MNKLAARMNKSSNIGSGSADYYKSEIARLKQLAAEEIDLTFIDEISNVRSEYSNTSIQELAASIEKEGLLNPIIVKATGSRYRIIAGHRRFKAVKSLKRQTIKAYLKDNINDDDIYLLQLTENIQRENLSPKDLENSIKALVESGYSQNQVADLVNKSKNWVSSVLSAQKIREHHGPKLTHTKNTEEIPTSTLIEVRGLEKEEQAEVLAKAQESGNTSRAKVRELKNEIQQPEKKLKPKITLIIYGSTKNPVARITDSGFPNSFVNKIKNAINDLGIPF